MAFVQNAETAGDDELDVRAQDGRPKQVRVLIQMPVLEMIPERAGLLGGFKGRLRLNRPRKLGEEAKNLVICLDNCKSRTLIVAQLMEALGGKSLLGTPIEKFIHRLESGYSAQQGQSAGVIA